MSKTKTLMALTFCAAGLALRGGGGPRLSVRPPEAEQLRDERPA